jgi:hypothetical protein
MLLPLRLFHLVSSSHPLLYQQKQNSPATKVIRKKMNMTGCLDFTGAKSVARTTLDGMSDSNKLEVDKEINKSLKKN